VRETRVQAADLVLPLFVVPGAGVRRPVGTMPGVEQTSADELVRDAAEAFGLGIPAVLLFGVPEEKDEVGSSGYNATGVVQEAVRALKRELPDLVVVTDVCLCEYTSHGHCGVLNGEDVDNDATLPLLGRMAVSHAEAGADVVAPSDMMDGRVAAIRTALDGAGHGQVPILSYAVKYASAFYGPFREAAESAPAFGDRRGYQMDPANVREALREARLDEAEGADLLMVKPALPYLDVIHRVRESTDLPVWAYHVSGEYAMVKAAAERGWIDGDRAMAEVLTSIKRAGADRIVTYHARSFARAVE
jgi:porphobilinogen synthase